MIASCSLFTWLKKLLILSSEWVTIAWVLLPPSIIYTSKYVSNGIHFVVGLVYLYSKSSLTASHSALVQAYYLATSFPVEKAPTQIIAVQKGLYPRGVYVSKLLNYPVRGLVFEGGNSLRDLSHVVARALVCLQDKNTPFNVLISDSGSRIFLLPQVMIYITHGVLSLLLNSLFQQKI